MADDSVVADSESKIITQFFLNTCRLRQPTKHHADAAFVSIVMATVDPPDSKEAFYSTHITGSTAEFYIRPMLSCVGDIDLMIHRSDELAIPAGYPPPSQLPAEFHSRVTAFEIIDCEYPGYVYLLKYYFLTENTNTDKYDFVQYERSQHNVCVITGVNSGELHGPANTVMVRYTDTEYSLDGVRCMRCLCWPTQAADWPTRHRNYGWPDSATVDRVVSNGCDVVQVAHRLCKSDERVGSSQWRLSFSRAEIVLLNSWMPVQQTIYHMLRFFVKTEGLTDITDHTGRKPVSNYHIKTLMLWACEMKPRSWWIDDLEVAGICLEILYDLAECLLNAKCVHYFINNCNLMYITSQAETIVSQLLSTSESWLSNWFVDYYLRKCARLCPDRVSRLFDDITTCKKLQKAVSAVVDWRLNNALMDYWAECYSVESFVPGCVLFTLKAHSYDHWIRELAKIHFSLGVYFTAVARLQVAQKTTAYGMSVELLDVLVTSVGQWVDRRRYFDQLSSVSSLCQATKLMKVVAKSSRSTVQLIEIELSKAYLYRALRCNDSDSHSIYCLANVYLAVLYYITGQHQTAIDHCTLVTRSQDHSQCSSHVVQGKILPKIDDNIDTVLGLSVFYQYVRTAALNQQQQTQHVSVFTTELFAHCMHIKCLSAKQCRQFTQMSSFDEGQEYIKSAINSELLFVADVMYLKLNMFAEICQYKPTTRQGQKLSPNSTELDTSELVELLQQSAVEDLTRYRQLQASQFGSVVTIVTTDFEAMYAYKRGDYQQCLQLSTHNIRILAFSVRMSTIPTFPQFIQLMDDDFVSLIAMTLIVNPVCESRTDNCTITQLTLSLYLMTQCQLKLHHSMTSLSQTLYNIKFAQRRHASNHTLEQLTLKLAERKVKTYLNTEYRLLSSNQS